MDHRVVVFHQQPQPQAQRLSGGAEFPGVELELGEIWAG
jgi:hypothetical protein